MSRSILICVMLLVALNIINVQGQEGGEDAVDEYRVEPGPDGQDRVISNTVVPHALVDEIERSVREEEME
ncbi:unnamed protein product [Colias eurytheme]|nr:unnamed protein product [Colias eurytheme]